MGAGSSAISIANVALMGGKEQLISFTAFNGDDIEAATVDGNLGQIRIIEGGHYELTFLTGYSPASGQNIIEVSIIASDGTKILMNNAQESQSGKIITTFMIKRSVTLRITVRSRSNTSMQSPRVDIFKLN